MQKLNLKIIKIASKTKMLNLERELNKHFLGCNTNGEPVECPFCHYISKNKRFSGKIWIDNNKKTFKCFSCGQWRMLKKDENIPMETGGYTKFLK